MEPPIREHHFEPTVKCSSCAANIELAAVAQHVCTIPSSTSTLSSFDFSHHEQRSRSNLPFRDNRPVLPKLDSSVASRSGLRPSEAASIAHDLGLPLPLSAGASSHRSPRRSRSRSRKASVHRPPSPDGPVSQDCAFPPFPMKPKKSSRDKEVKTHKPHSTSRSTTSTRAYQHSSNQSTSSSVYSTASAPAKRRTSNTSSSQRSRQGTVDDSMSLPSTAPSSPRQSLMSPITKEYSADPIQQLPALVLSESHSISEPNSTVSSMPPTPSWPLDNGQPSPKIVQSPGSDVAWTPTERTIPEEQIVEPQTDNHVQPNRNKQETFDNMFMQGNSESSARMFDNPPKEPLYKTKRPAPLLQPQRSVTDDPEMPRSARILPTPSSSGLARTLTSFFGRKRSQTSGPKTMPLPSFDSPRMRALAPDPPERPQRSEGLWDTDDMAGNTMDQRSPLPSPQHEKLVQLGDESMPVQEIGIVHEVNQPQDPQENTKEPAVIPTFEFKFNDADGVEAIPRHNFAMPETSFRARSPDIRDPTNVQTPLSEQELHRASVDSASSYGSIGFSHRSGSSKSDPPTSEDIKRLTPAPLTINQPSAAMIDLAAPSAPRAMNYIPDSPTDPLYHAGKLSPVPQIDSVQYTDSSEPERPLPKVSHSPAPSATVSERPKIARPETPAGTKGRCRGCSNLIMTGQKSVASADGRLTGRYHKECFACRTCREPFATADFYVFDDDPYCAHHYHILNNTLCTGCGKGIEGQYLETSDAGRTSSKKFHPQCLECATCKIQLDEDYFEFHGRVYCERDAFRAFNNPRNRYDTIPSRPSPLVREYINSEEPGLKGRFPERRTTRLIMN